jgi:hypothetical protein
MGPRLVVCLADAPKSGRHHGDDHPPSDDRTVPQGLFGDHLLPSVRHAMVGRGMPPPESHYTGAGRECQSKLKRISLLVHRTFIFGAHNRPLRAPSVYPALTWGHAGPSAWAASSSLAHSPLIIVSYPMARWSCGFLWTRGPRRSPFRASAHANLDTERM